MSQSFGKVIPVLVPNIGFPGKWSRTADSLIVARPVLPTTASGVLYFGAGAVLIASAIGGTFQSLADYLATATNAQFLQSVFAGVAVWNFKTQQPYSALSQLPPATVATTATQATPGSTTIVVASATGVAIGQSVEGSGLQAGTLVTAISGTTITISLPTLIAMSSANVVFTSPASVTLGSYAAGQEAEVLVRSSIVVAITAGTPQAGNAVYIRTVANTGTPGTSVGDFEAAAEVATSALTYGSTIGSTTLTTSAGTGLAPGQMVTGPGIPENTYIVSGATTSWVISNPALATIASGAALTAYNTALLGSAASPWIRFRTGVLDQNNSAEIMIPNRHAA